MSTRERETLRHRLEQDDGEYPTSWLPKVGDKLTGVLVRYDQGRTQFGPAHIAVIRDDETEELRSIWLIHHVLREKFKEERPQPGEWLGIKRLSDAERGDGGGSYRRYALVMDRGEPEQSVPDFDALGPAQDAPDDEAGAI